MSEDLARLFDFDPRPDPCESDEEIVHQRDRLHRYRPTATHSPWSNGVHWVRWDEQAVERGIDDVLAYYAARDAGFIWTVGPDTTPRDLGERLERRGLHLEARTAMLVATLPIGGLRTNPELVVRAVDDEARMRDSISVEHPEWDEERTSALLRERMAYLACPGHSRHAVIAYLGGVPISAARWRVSTLHPSIHLAGAETLAAYRGRGAYSTLVDYRTRIGLTIGCRYATIFADEATSAPILAKRGFRIVGRCAHYLVPGSRSSSS
ncbi:MAG TPA: hypothetical protein VFV20_02620 [Candidatus Limnocylindria bacterium]|nr:hypothetical protein [Candidatus Limnocylindria bacterium]